MNFFVFFSLCIISVAYSATLNTNPQCSVCKSTLDWVRSNENVLSSIKTDELVSNDFIELLESDTAAVEICGLFLMCQKDKGENDYLTVLRGAGRGGRGGHRRHGGRRKGRGKGHGKKLRKGQARHGKGKQKRNGKKLNKHKDHKKKHPEINVDPGQPGQPDQPDDCSDDQC